MSAPQAPCESAARAAVLVLAATALTVAISIRDGLYQPVAVAFLCLTCVLAFSAAFLSDRSLAKLQAARALWPAIALYFVLSFILAAVTLPGGYQHFQFDVISAGVRHTMRTGLEVYWSLTAIAAAVCGTLLTTRARPHTFALAILVTIFLALAIWLIRRDPNPHIDVFVFADESCSALAHGIDPYAITFTDIYHDPQWYAPGMIQNGRLLFGYPYMPLTLLLTFPGWLFGDPRYAGAVAVALSAILIARARPGPVATLAAAALMFMPRTLYIIDNAFSEPIVLLLLSLTIWCACQKPKLLPYAFGLLIATKQYMPVALILSPLLVGWDIRRLVGFVIRAVALAAAITLPIALWNPSAFMHSALWLQFAQPFRTDALSFMAAWYHAPFGHSQPPFFLAFLALAVAGVFALRLIRPAPAGFAIAMAVSFLAFFAFNKQAFANYYFFVLGTIWCAVASSDPPLMPAPASVR